MPVCKSGIDQKNKKTKWKIESFFIHPLWNKLCFDFLKGLGRR